jgi:hypothetical protein
MNSKKYWETRFARISLAHEFICYSASLFGRVSSLCVRESGSNFEFYSIISANLDSATHVNASAGASLMAYDSCLSIFKLLDFKQKVAAFIFIYRVRIFDHDTLCSLISNAVKFLKHMFLRFDFDVLY